MRAIIFSLVMLAVLSGCTTRTVPVETKVPTLETPARPQLENMTPEELSAYRALPESARKKFEGNDAKLKEYAQELEVTIKAYNKYAAIQNQKSDEWMGIAPKNGKVNK